MNHHKTDRTQAASFLDAICARIFALPALALAAAVATGCVGVAADTRATDAIAIERVDSAHAEVGSVQVRGSAEGIQVQARLHKRFAGRSPIRGHLHVEALGANGAVLAEAITPYRRLNPKMGLSEFSQPLAVSPGQVRVVRITHHLEHAGG